MYVKLNLFEYNCYMFNAFILKKNDPKCNNKGLQPKSNLDWAHDKLSLSQ